jgi:hypothetical protein
MPPYFDFQGVQRRFADAQFPRQIASLLPRLHALQHLDNLLLGVLALLHLKSSFPFIGFSELLSYEWWSFWGAGQNQQLHRLGSRRKIGRQIGLDIALPKAKSPNLSIGAFVFLTRAQRIRCALKFNWATSYSPTHLARAVPSGLKGLTSVFGMGTGGTPSLQSPKVV